MPKTGLTFLFSHSEGGWWEPLEVTSVWERALTRSLSLRTGRASAVSGGHTVRTGLLGKQRA